MGAHESTFTPGTFCCYERGGCTRTRTRTTTGRHGVATRSRHRVVLSWPEVSAGGLSRARENETAAFPCRTPPPRIGAPIYTSYRVPRTELARVGKNPNVHVVPHTVVTTDQPNESCYGYGAATRLSSRPDRFTCHLSTKRFGSVAPRTRTNDTRRPHEPTNSPARSYAERQTDSRAAFPYERTLAWRAPVYQNGVSSCLASIGEATANFPYATIATTSADPTPRHRFRYTPRTARGTPSHTLRHFTRDTALPRPYYSLALGFFTLAEPYKQNPGSRSIFTFKMVWTPLVSGAPFELIMGFADRGATYTELLQRHLSVSPLPCTNFKAENFTYCACPFMNMFFSF